MAFFDEVTCYKCKEPFCIERATRQVLLRSHANFFCPHGHQQHYLEGESEADKFRRERDRLKQQIAQKDDEIKWQRDAKERAQADAEHERHRANGYKGHATRITKRAKAGLCPCCNRSFENLRRHMETKHPKFTPIVIEGGKAVA